MWFHPRGELLGYAQCSWIYSCIWKLLKWDMTKWPHCWLPHGPPASFHLSQRASKLLRGDCLYRERRCLFPWASLFIWAVLQNRSEMATFFWEMVNLQKSLTHNRCLIWRSVFALTSLAVSCRQGSLCSALWVAVRCWGKYPKWRLRPKPNCPWKSWPRSLRTWHMVRYCLWNYVRVSGFWDDSVLNKSLFDY